MGQTEREDRPKYRPLYRLSAADHRCTASSPSKNTNQYVSLLVLWVSTLPISSKKAAQEPPSFTPTDGVTIRLAS
jgi:hypothetical protein